MNNIYVDELPNCCGNCSLCCKDDLGYWCQATILIYIDERFVAEKRLKSCPLKLLSDRLAEERKRVCEFLRESLNIRPNHPYVSTKLVEQEWFFQKLLDQIERNIDG